MSLLKALKKIGNAIVEDAMEQQIKRMRNGTRNTVTGKNEVQTIGGKTLRQWESAWKYIGYLDSLELGSYSGSVGLYKAELGSKIMYIGRAIEFSNGGIRKRLSDYTRESDSARKHTSGRLMNANASELKISIIVIGCDEDAAEATRKLEHYFIGRYSPEWNKRLR